MQSAFSLPLLDWYRQSHRALPWRKTRDPYAILVSEVMLQQTQVKTVIPYYERWMRRYPTLQALAAASEAEVLKAWEGLGYYRRARLLRAAARCIIEKFNGEFPHDIEGIAALPGVGRYTLGAVASIAFNQPLPVLDGNVIRVLCRWFEIRAPTHQAATRKQLWGLAESLIPEGASADFNQSIMELGATVCIPHNPFCLLCPVRQGCGAFARGFQEELPVAPPRVAVVKQFEYAGLVIRNGRALLAQRQRGQRMEELWQFPSITVFRPSRQWAIPWKEAFGAFKTAVRVETLGYAVTHHRIRLELFRIEGFNRRKMANTRWVPLATVPALAFTSAHRKLANRFLQTGPERPGKKGGSAR